MLHISDEIKNEKLSNGTCIHGLYNSNNKTNNSLSIIVATTTCDEKEEFTQAKKYTVFAVAGVSQIL